jgi:hypothetical protein
LSFYQKVFDFYLKDLQEDEIPGTTVYKRIAELEEEIKLLDLELKEDTLER